MSTLHTASRSTADVQPVAEPDSKFGACPAAPIPAPDAESLAADLARYLTHHLGRATPCDPHYLNLALSWAIRDRLMADWQATQAALNAPNQRRACYLSLEYLMGRILGNQILNRGVGAAVDDALSRFSIDLETLEDHEHDAGLGNGGLGRLAACFIDSAATLGLPLIGYGLRYEYGMFIQAIHDGNQVEEPDHWLRDGFPWEIARPEATRIVRFGGHTVHEQVQHGGQTQLRVRWVDTDDVLAVPYDIPVPGYRHAVVNTLRLWKAEATDAFSLHDFNSGAYAEAVAEKNSAENITMVLYPNDATENGKELRLRQQYLLSSASLQDTLANWLARRQDQPWAAFPEQHLFQLNDTHPAIAIAELMRLLVDEHQL
ncbi:MAG: glycogen/starch/alpha-glucan phosphorylase, partial [Thioalkalivibrionaceae bacterium]